MALKHLSEEEVRTWTLEEKDRWWLENVYKGEVPQLNFRSAVTGMVLGGALSLTNLYVGIRTGWTLGVGISSVILSFAMFKFLSVLGWGKEMTILENNAMQSIATSAGYMAAPMMSSLSAYMLVTGQVIPMWQTYCWISVLSILGVFFAFPLKRRFINDDQLPFPEGYASGVVLDSLHEVNDQGSGRERTFKVRLLLSSMSIAAVIELLRSEKIVGWLGRQWEALGSLQIPEHWDDLIYKKFTPMILGTPLRDLTIQIDSSIVMMGTGGLMSMRTAFSLLLGGVLNFVFLSPYLIREGIIPTANFKSITMWSLWGGVGLMTTASLYSFFSKPQMILSSFQRILRWGGKGSKDFEETEVARRMKKIELPLSLSLIGVPMFGALLVWMGHSWFGIDWWLGVFAIPLVFVFSLIAVNSTGLTAITPGGALGKLTQITYSVLAPGNISTNLMTAGIAADVSLSASNLLMDIKPGYMLGGKPRHQALGHVLGIFAGGLVAVPVFYLLFHGDISLLTSEVLPLPGAVIWRAVAEILTKGLSQLHFTAKLALGVGAILGVVFEYGNQRMKGAFPLSSLGLGLGFVLTFKDSLMMFLGAFIFWLMRHLCKRSEGLGYRVFVDNQETLSAGVIAGGSIIGLIIMIIESQV